MLGEELLRPIAAQHERRFNRSLTVVQYLDNFRRNRPATVIHAFHRVGYAACLTYSRDIERWTGMRLVRLES